MKVYVFGNIDLPQDSSAITVAKKLNGKINNVEFVYVKPNSDLPFVDEKNVVIMDVIQGIKKVTILEDKDLDNLVLPPRTTAHDFDLGFQLKYLKKLGKIGEVKIIGLPMENSFKMASVKNLLKQL